MMKCGCAAQSRCGSFRGVKYDPPIPSCVIHDCIEVAESPPDLVGRIAKCAYSGCRTNPRKCTHYGEYGPDGRSQAPSDPEKLPFFEHKPDEPYDLFYCGCHGWE